MYTWVAVVEHITTEPFKIVLSSGITINIEYSILADKFRVRVETPNLSRSIEYCIIPDNWSFIQVYYDGMKLVISLDDAFDALQYNSVIGEHGCTSNVSSLVVSFNDPGDVDTFLDELGIWCGADALRMIQQKSSLYNDGNGRSYPIEYT